MPNEDYQAIGRRLRDNRLRHQLSIKQVAASLHIRAQYVEALENGAPELLPGLAYARGYLHTYAEFLGLDAAFLMDAFEKAGEFPHKKLFHFPESMDRNPNPSMPLVYSTLLGAVLVMTIWVAFAPAPRAIAPNVPFPVSGQVLKLLPDACKMQHITAYPPCFWQQQPLVYGVVSPKL